MIESLRFDSEDVGTAGAFVVDELLLRRCLELAPSPMLPLSSPWFGELVLDRLEALDLAPEELLEEYPDDFLEEEESEMEPPSCTTFNG